MRYRWSTKSEIWPLDGIISHCLFESGLHVRPIFMLISFPLVVMYHVCFRINYFLPEVSDSNSVGQLVLQKRRTSNSLSSCWFEDCCAVLYKLNVTPYISKYFLLMYLWNGAVACHCAVVAPSVLHGKPTFWEKHTASSLWGAKVRMRFQHVEQTARCAKVYPKKRVSV